MRNRVVLSLFCLAMLSGSLSLPAAAQTAKLYWTAAEGEVRRANLDGSGVETLIPDLAFLEGLAVDIAGERLYWCEPGASRIGTADLVGGGATSLLTVECTGIAVDGEGRRLYWTQDGGSTSARIRRVDLDAADLAAAAEDVVTAGLFAPQALTLAGGFLYWADSVADVVGRAELDGTDPTELITGVAASSVAVDVRGGKVYWADQNADEVRRADLDGMNPQLLGSSTNPFGFGLDAARGDLYWLDDFELVRTALDGSGRQVLTDATGGLRSLALVYWPVFQDGFESGDAMAWSAAVGD